MPEQVVKRLRRKLTLGRGTTHQRKSAGGEVTTVRQHAAFAALSQQLIGVETSMDAARAIAAVTDEYLHWDAYSFTIHNPDHYQNYDVLDYDIVDGQRVELPSNPHGYTPGTLFHQIVNNGPQLILREASVFEPEMYRPFGDTSRPSESLMYVLIRSNGRILGLVSTQSYTPHAYTQDDLAFLQSLADMCGGAFLRIRAESIIRSTEVRYRHMVDLSPHPTAVLSGSIFLYANAAALKLIGATMPHQLIGQPAFAVLHPRGRDLTPEQGDAFIQHMLDAGWIETELRRLDGHLIDVELSLIPVTFDEKPATMAVARDVTEQKRAERRSAAFTSLGQELSIARTPEAAAAVIAKAADDLMTWDAFALSLYDHDSNRMYPLLNLDVIDGTRQVVQPNGMGYEPGNMTRALMSGSGQLILREDHTDNPLELTTFGDHSRPSASLIFVPLIRDAEFIGILSVQSYTPFAYTNADLQTAQALADHCSGSLERLRAEAAMRASEQRFRVLFEHAADAIFLVDPHHPDGEWPIVDCNDVACRLNGYTRHEMIGRSIRMLRVQATGGEEEAEFLKDLRANAVVSFETHNRRKDGSQFPIESSASLVRLDSQELVLEIDRDISERKRVEAAMMIAHEAALETSRLKSEFLATMSHEIRTPMNGVIGMTELLLGTQLDVEQHEFATVVRDSAHALLNILNDILDFSKIEAGKLAIVTSDFMPQTIVASVIDLLAFRAQEQGIALKSVIAPNVPPVIHGDSQRLRQILLNLVSNAVKFTARGEVTLQMEASRMPDGMPCLHVAVRDTGIGISSRAQRHLFESFVQADGSTTRKYGGTGLGLAISKRLVELMGGSIAVESKEGVGSTFSFMLPYAMPKDDAKVVAEAEPALLAPSTRPHLILVAEDNLVNQKVAMMQLQKLGYQAHAVANGMEAIAAVARRYETADSPYDLILMDCHMPEIDGFAATAAIRTFERWRSDGLQDEMLQRSSNVPIVAMTANAMRGDREACIAAGMNDYVSKPVRITDLQAVLHRWLPPVTTVSV